MLEVNGNNDAARMLDGDCKIYVQESEKLLGPKKSQNLQINIEFNDLCYSARDRKGTEKTILRNVTGHFETGKVTVIIGPSGVGKTTLLKIISGRRLIGVTGNIIVNGVERNIGTFRKQVCYVPQQFHLLPLLTTKETFYIAARLKLNINQNEAIHLIINEIAKNLGLLNCLDTLASKLSGGEQRRLSIGVEMITRPSVFLLDEPTSGLDSVASNQLVNILHDMARANCTVVCTIHQPSSQMISLFDDIMVLDRGRCIYCGPKSEILNTYSIAGFTCPNFYNIAEFVLEVTTEQKDGDLENLYNICREEYEKFKSRTEYNKNKLEPSTDSKQKNETCNKDTSINSIIQKKSTWEQQKVLFLRALICIKRDNTLTKLRLAVHFATSLFLGTVFYNFGDNAEKVISNISYFFIHLLFLYLCNSVLTVLIIPTEAAVFLQEHSNNWYSLRSYYSMKILTDLPIQILCTSSYVFISYYMTGQPMELDRILGVWVICLLITILGQTVGIFVGTAFGIELGVFLIPATSIPFYIFGGFFMKIEETSIYLQPLGVLSFIRYAFEGMMQAVYLDRPKLSCSEMYCHWRSPNKILSMMGIPTVPFYVTLLILVSWILCLHTIAYALFRWKIYHAEK
ncbi:PREDICTED: ATP-binding cassette sub-family G member 1-like isoform X1 [Wasmannia auropunctata]|uniref:ATP-binding cassette sub-family G member 1-like isoform X1 n=1 Tax=Wasmannia auropunctata TaxID=64793 RepID=UPI0005EFCF23|nr:PREDICTED: ATP-binding cassette sub-family G member 1-like isoform X1 [Wasmannia auropunctata]XP_011686847.1 PREDICTED: ATP-binding cassette sub-family G member 1-like isoform X1 [Wasmannia auropunctata]